MVKNRPLGTPDSSLATVFVVGAGASKDLGYPLTHNLLFGLIPKLDDRLRTAFKKVVSFHHPTWNGRAETLPDIEEFLTELSANQDLLPELRPEGPFGPEQLQKTRDGLLLGIAKWFHQIHEKEFDTGAKIREQLLNRILEGSRAVVVSFNWDLELDRGIFGPERRPSEPMGQGYGLQPGLMPKITLLKPHGSLNWHPEETGEHLKSDRSERLWEPSDEASQRFQTIYCFHRWRQPKSSHDRLYVPWIVPPTHLKNFEHPMLRQVWMRCVEALSTAGTVYFLGYSLPPADWHSRYIFRCGFHNQLEGIPKGSKSGSHRAPATGPAEVVVVNPDNAAFRRIEAVVGRDCQWVPKTIAEWLNDGA